MKTIFTHRLWLIASGLCLAFILHPSSFNISLAGPVYFPLQTMVGTTNDTTINVKAINNPILYNGSIYYLPKDGTNLTTVNGVVTNNFIPGRYTVTVAGNPQAWTISVTNNTSAVNAVDLSKGLVIYSGVQSVTAGSNTVVLNDGQGNLTVSSTGGSGAGVTGAELVETSTNGTVVTTLVRTQAIFRAIAPGYQTNFNASATNQVIRASGGPSTKALRVVDVTDVEQFSVDDEGLWATNIADFAVGSMLGISADGKFIRLTGAITNNTTGNAATATTASEVSANVTNKWQADALAAAQNATNKFKSDVAAGTVPVAAAALTGSGTLPPAVFPTTPPNNYAPTNRASFINGISFYMPPSYGVPIPIVIGTNYGPGMNIFGGYFTFLGWSSGFKWQNQAGTEDIAILDEQGQYYPKKVIISDQSSAFKGPATETKDTYYTDFIGRQMPVPILGWNSFYEAPGVGGAPAVSAALVTNAVQRRIANGMRDAGFNIIAIDDSWMQTNRVNNRIVANSNNFPNGIQPVVDYCHANGFKFEIYLAVGGETTCGGTAGTPFRYLEQDIMDCISWGVDGFKLDRCNVTTDGFSNEQWFRKVSALSAWAIHNAHDAVGYDWTNGLKQIYTLVTSDSYYDAFGVDYSRRARPAWTGLGGVNIWQTGNASIIGIASVSNMLIRLEKAQNSIWFRGIGHYEELLPFSTGTNNFSYPIATSNECRTAMTANALGPSPTYPCDGTTNIFAFTNRTVNRIIQDPGCVPGVFIYSNDYVRAMTRPLYPLRGTNSALGESTENAVAIFNPNAAAKTVALDVSLLNLKSNVCYQVYDCWSNSVVMDFTNAFTWNIIGDRADLLKIYPSTNFTHAPAVGQWVSTPNGQFKDQYSAGVFYEKDDFLRSRFIVSGSQTSMGDLGWYYWTISGGALVNTMIANSYNTNYPRIGIQAMGNSGTTSGYGFQFSPTSLYEVNYQPLMRPDFATNWQTRFVVRLINTNGTNYRIGMMGGSTFALLADPDVGAYFRFNTNSAGSAEWQFITKGATTTTNNMGVADSSNFHTFRIFNDTGITNIVRAQIDSGTIVSVTNALNQYGFAPQIYGHSVGGTGTAPQLWIDYYDLYISGIQR